jgi:hypothetical protein
MAGKLLRAWIARTSFATAAALLAACSSGATLGAPPTGLASVNTPPPPPPPLEATPASPGSPPQVGFTVRTQIGQPPGGFLVIVSGLDPNEPFVLVMGAAGQRESSQMQQVADARGTRTIGFGAVAPGGSCVLAQRSSGEIARADAGVAPGSTCAALDAAVSSSPAQASVPASFALRTEAGQAPGALTVIVSGLDPNESFQLVAAEAGTPTSPLAQVADGRGGMRIGFSTPPRGLCLLAKRTTGEIARANDGLAPGATCPADIVYLYQHGPTTVGPTQFTDFTSVAPKGSILEWLSFVGPDGPHTPGFTAEPLPSSPVAVMFRFSPEYERQGPLPAGKYRLSYRLMGERYDFTLTLVR